MAAHLLITLYDINYIVGKHPVSALVELCNKRKWGPPQFEFIFECGPDHKKNFLCKVRKTLDWTNTKLEVNFHRAG